MYYTLTLDQMRRPEVLNIFTDASVRKMNTPRGQEYVGCYGAIAITGDTKIDDYYRLLTDSTNNNCEIRGLGAAINMAIAHRSQFNSINIFSDSEQAVKGLRDRVTSWKIYNGVMYTRQGTPAQSQDVYAEIIYTILDYNLNVNIYQQKSHVSSSEKSYSDALKKFKTANRLWDIKIDMSFIEYISYWNNYIDKATRGMLDNFDGREYTDPLAFYPVNFNRAHYKELMQINKRYL